MYDSHKFYFNLIVDFSLNRRIFGEEDLNLDQLEESLNFRTSRPHSNSNESTIVRCAVYQSTSALDMSELT